MLAMMMLLMLASTVYADQDHQCLEHGACAAQCAASLRVCIADCSPTPPEQPDNEEKGRTYLCLQHCSLSFLIATPAWPRLITTDFVLYRSGRNFPHQRGHYRGNFNWQYFFSHEQNISFLMSKIFLARWAKYFVSYEQNISRHLSKNFLFLMVIVNVLACALHCAGLVLQGIHMQSCANLQVPMCNPV